MQKLCSVTRSQGSVYQRRNIILNPSWWKSQRRSNSNGAKGCEAEARHQELELEKEKPFARTRDDPELDQLMRTRLRWGDPTAHLVKKETLVDLGDDEKMKESGFIIPKAIPKHTWMEPGLEASTNRYGIKPGRHWDGVDRSN